MSRITPTATVTPLLVDPQWLHDRLDDPSLRILDCTTYMFPQPVGPSRIESGRPDFERGHVPGAQYVNMATDMSEPGGAFPYTLPSPQRIEEVLGALGIGNEHHIVLYGRGHPMPVTRVWYVLRAHGHDAVSVLDGGFERWQREGRPTSQTPRSWPRTRYQARPDPRRIADADTVHAALTDPATRIVNALSREQHGGTGGAHYGRPGRIPGSVNVPARELVDPDTGCFLPEQALRARCAAAGALDAPRTIVYCGGGIAATTTAFAMALLGHDGWCVYDNSLLEWSADPARPMESDAG